MKNQQNLKKDSLQIGGYVLGSGAIAEAIVGILIFYGLPVEISPYISVILTACLNIIAYVIYKKFFEKSTIEAEGNINALDND